MQPSAGLPHVAAAGSGWLLALARVLASVPACPLKGKQAQLHVAVTPPCFAPFEYGGPRSLVLKLLIVRAHTGV